jgi:hypothetical protein
VQLGRSSSPRGAAKSMFTEFIAGGKLDLSEVPDPLIEQFTRDNDID